MYGLAMKGAFLVQSLSESKDALIVYETLKAWGTGLFDIPFIARSNTIGYW